MICAESEVEELLLPCSELRLPLFRPPEFRSEGRPPPEDRPPPEGRPPPEDRTPPEDRPPNLLPSSALEEQELLPTKKGPPPDPSAEEDECDALPGRDPPRLPPSKNSPTAPRLPARDTRRLAAREEPQRPAPVCLPPERENSASRSSSVVPSSSQLLENAEKLSKLRVPISSRLGPPDSTPSARRLPRNKVPPAWSSEDHSPPLVPLALLAPRSVPLPSCSVALAELNPPDRRKVVVPINDSPPMGDNRTLGSSRLLWEERDIMLLLARILDRSEELLSGGGPKLPYRPATELRMLSEKVWMKSRLRFPCVVETWRPFFNSSSRCVRIWGGNEEHWGPRLTRTKPMYWIWESYCIISCASAKK